MSHARDVTEKSKAYIRNGIAGLLPESDQKNPVNKPLLPEDVPSKSQLSAKVIVDSIRSAPEIAQTVYRGIGSQEVLDTLKDVKVGEVLKLGGIASFTEDPHVANYFCRFHKGKDPAVLVCEGVSKAIRIPDEISSIRAGGRILKEWLTEGKFEIVKIAKEKIGNNYRRTIHIKQIGVF